MYIKLKSTFLFIFICFYLSNVNGQSLDYIYQAKAYFYLCYMHSGTNSVGYNSPGNNSYVYLPKVYGLGVNLGLESYHTDKLFAAEFTCPLLSDITQGIISVYKKRKEVDPNSTKGTKIESPFMASLIDWGVGMNLFGSDRLVLNTGIKSNVYIFDFIDHVDYNGFPDESIYQVGATIGPQIRFDMMLGESIMFRIKTGYEFIQFLGATADKANSQRPNIFTFSPQFITNFGLYFGAKYSGFYNFKSYSSQIDNFDANKFDIFIGFRYGRR